MSTERKIEIYLFFITSIPFFSLITHFWRGGGVLTGSEFGGAGVHGSMSTAESAKALTSECCWAARARSSTAAPSAGTARAHGPKFLPQREALDFTL